MLQIQNIRENKEQILSALFKRNKDFSSVVEEVITIDAQRRKIQQELEAIQAQSNALAKQIGDLFKSGQKEAADALKAQTVDLKNNAKMLETQFQELENEQTQLLYQLPNTPHESVVFGKGAEENVIVKEWGQIPALGENNKPHWDLADQFGLIDFETGVKITGAGFPIYRGKGAILQRALINFFLDENIFRKSDRRW